MSVSKIARRAGHAHSGLEVVQQRLQNSKRIAAHLAQVVEHCRPVVVQAVVADEQQLHGS